MLQCDWLLCCFVNDYFQFVMSTHIEIKNTLNHISVKKEVNLIFYPLALNLLMDKEFIGSFARSRNITINDAVLCFSLSNENIHLTTNINK